MKPAPAIPSLFDARTERTFDVERARDDFPILRKRISDHQLVYLDNAATTQKPSAFSRR
jgi:cysteine desulfurase/selenocysteine lyase